jgi:hypothetical protein
VDGDRFTHNPEVAGSNPAPATSFGRSRPFPIRERAFCVPGTVVKPVVAAGLRAARQRDGGDGMTRDETARTRWTLPPATAGRLAQRSRKCIPLSSHSRWISWKHTESRVRSVRQRLYRGIRLPIGRDPRLLEFNDGVAGRRGAVAAGYFLQGALRRAVGLSWQPARVTAAMRGPLCVEVRCPGSTRTGILCDAADAAARDRPGSDVNRAGSAPG